MMILAIITSKVYLGEFMNQNTKSDIKIGNILIIIGLFLLAIMFFSIFMAHLINNRFGLLNMSPLFVSGLGFIILGMVWDKIN